MVGSSSSLEALELTDRMFMGMKRLNCLGESFRSPAKRTTPVEPWLGGALLSLLNFTSAYSIANAVILPRSTTPRGLPFSDSKALSASAMSTTAQARLVYGKNDALFGSIEKRQGAKPFGTILDAGTGLHSLRWIATLGYKGMKKFTAVTADETMQRNCQRELEALGLADTGKVVMGNWFADDENEPQHTLNFEGEQLFDVILADYLIGAMDGFSPYKQDLILPKLVKHLKPDGRLYIVGLEPIPDTVPIDNLDTDAGIVCKVRQVRDACILLAGHRCYREYPVDWVHRQIHGLAPDLVLLQTKQFPILYRHATIVKQINVGRSKLPYMPVSLQETMRKVLDELEAESLQATTKSPTGRIQLGFDYVVTAEKPT